MPILSELYRLLPITLYFFLSFSLINHTEALMFRDQNITSYPILLVLTASLIVAKVLLVIDHLPLITILRKKPLIYDIAYKTLLYSLATVLLRLLLRAHPIIPQEHLPPFNWQRFWAIQIWYTVLFFLFVFTRDLSNALGTKALRKLLFKPRN